MSLFQRNFYNDRNDLTSFQPLFRLLDDFDSYQNKHHYRGSNVMKSFTPKFDVKEAGEAYELHGELPGVEQKDIEVEFTDSQTLVIRGRTERSYTSGTPPADFAEAPKTSGTIEGEKSHKATVEDEDMAETEVSKTSNEDAIVEKKDEKYSEQKEKYWVSERSIGEFSRSFTFPVRVDADQVQASMKNGILSIVVPKAKKEQARKITIS